MINSLNKMINKVKPVNPLTTIKRYLLLLGFSSTIWSAFAQGGKAVNGNPWDKVPAILASIEAPVFPNKDFNIKDYGAVGDGKTNSSGAIRKAIEACNRAGGGRVVVPAGRYLTGPVYLKSNVNFFVDKGATILFSTNPKDYLPLVRTRWEGVELMNYSPLIYAYEEHNIAITGEGTLDGQASTDHWWPWKGKKDKGYVAGTPSQLDAGNRDALFDMAEKDVPLEKRVFGEGHYLRPQFVQPYKCTRVLIQGVKVVRSPMWIINPVLCNNVTIKGITVESNGPNNDGCDPESCKDVLIKDCYFNTGDDCIALKSGRNRDGRRINVPCENVVIQHCTMANGHGGVVIGSEISGGVKNVFAEDCQMNSPELDRALRIKTSTARGGITENIYLRNIKVGRVKQEAILITMFYEDKGNFMPLIRNIRVDNMQVAYGGKTGIVVEGYKAQPVQNLQLSNLQINNVKHPYHISNLKGLKLEKVEINGKNMRSEEVKILDTEGNLHW
ncbi:Pectate lyase superfamily protein [Pedobacter rhizosphaerae]|uniref:Pectate lyase superfamily protein n=2 Tax=Pedobacter rhizosphaerae TaxID=390241 RepID=A0A1H9P6A0_9SPHI|nr:Pectate lyase superfamily protein [Pedobacter rhizosphaerae]